MLTIFLFRKWKLRNGNGKYVQVGWTEAVTPEDTVVEAEEVVDDSVVEALAVVDVVELDGIVDAEDEVDCDDVVDICVVRLEVTDDDVTAGVVGNDDVVVETDVERLVAGELRLVAGELICCVVVEPEV